MHGKFKFKQNYKRGNSKLETESSLSLPCARRRTRDNRPTHKS